MEFSEDGESIISKGYSILIRSQSLEIQLLVDILRKLEEIRCGIIDVEEEVHFSER